MSIQSKQGSPNTSVCFRYTRLSSKWHSRAIGPPRRSETSGKAVRFRLFSINLEAFQCCQVASPSNKLGRVSGYFLSPHPPLPIAPINPCHARFWFGSSSCVIPSRWGSTQGWMEPSVDLVLAAGQHSGSWRRGWQEFLPRWNCSECLCEKEGNSRCVCLP